jgi:acetylglutamate kinase
MRKAGKESRFIHGFRVTDRETVHIVDRALKKINAKVVKAMSGAGAKAFGLSGKDNGLIKVRRIKEPPGLGFVGEVTSIDTTVVKHLLDSGYIPVIYPLGVGRDGNLYNVNADDAASELAVALRAEKFVLLTNVRGVLREKDDPASLYHTLTAADIKRLIKKKVIDKGMIPKVKACVNAIKGGVKKAHMLDAGIPHALLLEIFTDEGIGTEIVK